MSFMKTTYETREDIEFLDRALCFAALHTEKIFEPVYNTVELLEYRNKLIDFRFKLYEVLGYADPNQAVIDKLKERVITRSLKDFET
jgi:hypothetical protein